MSMIIRVLYCLLLFIGLFFVPSALAESLGVKKWEMMEISLKTEKDETSTFDERVICLLQYADDPTLPVHAFYNGNNEWIVRFTANKAGTWGYVIDSTVEDLNGISGSIEVEEIDGTTRGRGGIRICPDDPDSLCYADGTSYNLLAHEVDWLFALDYGDLELPKTRQLIEAIQDNGFNQVIMNVYAFDAPWPKDQRLKPEHNYGARLDIYPFGGTNENPDHTTLNVDFFKHLDRVIELLEQNGIVAHLMIYVWNKGVNWPVAGSIEDNRYFDYVVKRYQAYPNLLWDISKEALAYGRDDMDYITQRIERLRQLDAHDRLVTVHDFSYCSEFPEMLDIISVQTWKTDLYARMMEIHHRFPDKPILNIEHGGYEEGPFRVFTGDYSDPVACLRRNYHIAFAGAYSSYYWQGTAWYAIIHDPFAEDVDPHPRFDYYKYFSEFLERVNFEDLTPSEDNGTSGLCLVSQDQGAYVYYIPADNDSLIAQDLSKAERIGITWFNPLTGRYSEETFRDWRKNIRLKNPDNGQDNIAILRMITNPTTPHDE